MSDALVYPQGESPGEDTGEAGLLPARRKLPKKQGSVPGTVSRAVAGTLPEKKPLVKVKVRPGKIIRSGWALWWPLLAGAALGFLSPRMMSVVDGWDPWGVRVVFPFVQFCSLSDIGLSAEMTRALPELMLFLQFPLEGLLTVSNLRRGVKLSAAMTQLVFLHAVTALVLWIVAIGTAAH